MHKSMVASLVVGAAVCGLYAILGGILWSKARRTMVDVVETEGPVPRPGVYGGPSRETSRAELRGLQIFFVALLVMPPIGWLVGAVLGPPTALRVGTGLFGWGIATFLVIGAFWLGRGIAAFRELRRG